MFVTAPARSRAAALTAVLLVACGGAASPAPVQTDAPTATPAATAVVTTAPQANAITWTVDASSKATIRVREQLARLPAPNDAIITITGAQGSFRTSELAPTKTVGLALPLARSGDIAFQLIGDLTLHGVTKSVTFDVKATRANGKLTATATATPSWKFGDFGMRPPSSFSVLSIVDEIRMEFALVANEATA